MSGRLSSRQVWAAPAALGLASAVGLTSALLADGAGDVISWLALGLPAVVCLWGLGVPQPRRRSGLSARDGETGP